MSSTHDVNCKKCGDRIAWWSQLEDFINCVKCGGFIDYDGYGYYIKDNQESDIEIYPSDVKHKAIRTDFDTIIWFNR